MFCGIKILDLAVDAAKLRAQDHLRFGVVADIEKMIVLNPIQWASHRGLTFTLVPLKNNPANHRVELAGSLHKYGRDGRHNADDFTALDLQNVIDELTDTYGIDSHSSILNTLEFGVNLSLPFPVSNLLYALITHRGVPFTKHNDNGFDYYQAKRQQYIVKIYDKGQQFYKNEKRTLRFEIKVTRMKYLQNRQIPIHVLADLLNQELYASLGELLVNTFKEILFDDCGITLDEILPRYRVLLSQGRNPRFWEKLDPHHPHYSRLRKQKQRDEHRFRKLLAAYRHDPDWSSETALLLQEKWAELIYLPEVCGNVASANQPCSQLTGACRNLTNYCPHLTGAPESRLFNELSRINPKDVGVFGDIGPAIEPVHCGCVSPAACVGGAGREGYQRDELDSSGVAQISLPAQKDLPFVDIEPRYCPATGIRIDHQPAIEQFISAETLNSIYKNDWNRFNRLARQFLHPIQQRYTVDEQCSLIAFEISEKFNGK